MTKREEAAQALYEQQVANKVVKSQFWDLPDSVQDKYYAAVDAVIACIREPDEKMLLAGDFAGAPEDGSATGDCPTSKEVWQAMIDAIGD